jgi:hypothetical protein
MEHVGLLQHFTKAACTILLSLWCYLLPHWNMSCNFFYINYLRPESWFILPPVVRTAVNHSPTSSLQITYIITQLIGLLVVHNYRYLYGAISCSGHTPSEIKVLQYESWMWRTVHWPKLTHGHFQRTSYAIEVRDICNTWMDDTRATNASWSECQILRTHLPKVKIPSSL